MRQTRSPAPRSSKPPPSGSKRRQDKGLDSHLTSAQPTDGERSAIDGELGEPDPCVRHPRHLLLPVLHAIHSRIGWISPGALNYAALRLGLPPAEVHGVASFYGMFSLA